MLSRSRRSLARVDRSETPPSADASSEEQPAKDSNTPGNNIVDTRLNDTPEIGLLPLSCAACRTRHLKCDHGRPACSRCERRNEPCSYPSKRRRRNEDLIVQFVQSPPTDVPPPEEPSLVFETPEVPRDLIAEMDMNQLLNTYYASFHRCHPFVLPRPYLMSQLQRDRSSVAPLLAVMAYIGSLYEALVRSEPYKQVANDKMAQMPLPQTGFTVQALLLFAIALEWSNEMERAREVLEESKALALTLQMHRREFAVQNGQASLVLEESWRRTWWEVFVIDALFAGIRKLPGYSLWSESYDADLPAEEHCYFSGVRISSLARARWWRIGPETDNFPGYPSAAYSTGV